MDNSDCINSLINQGELRMHNQEAQDSQSNIHDGQLSDLGPVFQAPDYLLEGRSSSQRVLKSNIMYKY